MTDKQTSLQMVLEFHTYSGHPIEDYPKFPSTAEHIFRVEFMKEEAEESEEGYEAMDIVKYADSLGDLQYVLDGWFLVSGLWHKKQEIMEEIHRSNMTKFCKTVEEAERTIDKLVTQDAVILENILSQGINQAYQILQPAYHYEEVGNFFVVKNAQGKVQKGVNYEPPKLEEILYGNKKV